MMAKFSESIPEETRQAMVKHKTPQEQAERYAYRNENDKFYMPSSCILRLLRESAGNHKMRGTRKSAKYAVPGAISVQPDCLLLTNGDGKTEIDQFGVDSRSVVIPSTKGRIMCHRPKFSNWSLKMTIHIDDEILPPDFVKQILTEGGKRQGIGAFRPSCGGAFGTFLISEWNEVK